MKVDGSLKSLIQGVSQQPARNRLAGQCTLQDNMMSDPVEGLKRRPPLDWIAELYESTDEAQWYEFIVGDNVFIVVALPTEIKVFDLDGTEKTVTEVGGAFSYLGGDLAFTSIDNSCIIANKTTVCRMIPDEFADFRDYGSIVYIRGGNYARKYSVTITYNAGSPSGTLTTLNAFYQTPDGTSASHGADIATDNITAALVTALDTADSSNIFTFTRVNDLIYINWNSARTDKFTVRVGDGMGNVNIVAINNQALNTSFLPKYAPHNYHVAITGDGNAGADDWYLVFTVAPDAAGTVPASGEGFGREGVWIETVKNKTAYKVDNTTMPYLLDYDPETDEFSFHVGEWAGRQVGDTDSNPDPSFIGRTINDLFYFQGRFGILSGPATILSRTNRPFDFWIETATGVTDSDAIDIESRARGVESMLKAVPYNRDLVIFSNNAQFILFGRSALTPSNSALVLTTKFESDLNADPVVAGKNIFFTIKYGRSAGVREFYTEGSEDINNSRPITQHVNTYIEGFARHMASTSNFEIMLLQASAANIIYSYEYVWLGDQKAQSSWSRFILPNDVHHFFFVENIIYVIQGIGNKCILCKLDLNTIDDEGLTYQVKLDNKLYIEDVNTSFVYPNTLMAPIEDMVFVQGLGCPNPGLTAEVSSYNADTRTVTFKRDMQGGTIICGQRYTSKYIPTLPMVKDQDGVEIGTGKLTISKFIANCKDSGTLNAKLTSPYRDDIDLQFTGFTVNSPNALTGEPVVTDQSYIIPFRDTTKNAELELYTNSHYPLTISDLEWKGQYTKKGRRITQGD